MLSSCNRQSRDRTVYIQQADSRCYGREYYKYDPDKIRGISNNTGDTNCNGRFDPDDASNLLGYYAYASGFTKENEREMMTFVEWLLDKKLITEEQAKALD